MAEPARFTPTGTALVVKPKSVRGGGLPPEIEHDPALIEAVSSLLPPHYNFEIAKTVWKLREARAKRVALQFPEGLLLFACTIADILTTFTGAEAIVMGDVTYGACCVDDLSAAALGADFLVHYGHSCLVPIDATAATVRMLYVFVDIAFDESHLRACVVDNFPASARLAILGTIQFAPTLHALRAALAESHPHVVIPQAKPLSPGEVLGCTSPDLSALALDAYVFVADGRFHLESVMVHNPTLPAYRYDPYTKIMSREYYDTAAMMGTRRAAIDAAAGARKFGLILGTLGRQGNVALLKRLQDKLAAAGRDFFVLLLSEISPAKLAMFTDIDAWIQVACPRLSIDWSGGFAKPVLTPYEAEVRASGVLRVWGAAACACSCPGTPPVMTINNNNKA